MINGSRRVLNDSFINLTDEITIQNTTFAQI